MVVEYTTEFDAEISGMLREHRELLSVGRIWSLRELFSTPDCDIDDYSRDFRPSPFGDEACARVERFCRDHGIWLEPGGPYYNSMTPYLHPGAITAERMTVIGLYNAILYWLNDTVGREKFGHLTPDRQEEARVMVARLSDMLRTRRAPADATSLETAVAEFLAMLTPEAEPRWLTAFLWSTIEHLHSGIRDQNARGSGRLLSVADYIELRAHVSGMYPAVALCEYGRDVYLPWDRLTGTPLAAGLWQLRILTVEIGALMNDVFSFEKECIVDRADFNLIPVYLLNNPGCTLVDAVTQAAALVLGKLSTFRRCAAELLAACPEHLDPRTAAAVRAHLTDLTGCVQATWVWQNITPRYKGESVFLETRR